MGQHVTDETATPDPLGDALDRIPAAFDRFQEAPRKQLEAIRKRKMRFF